MVNVSDMEHIRSKLQDTVRQSMAIPALDFSNLPSAPAKGVPQAPTQSTPRSLGDVGHVKPNRPAPDLAKMNNPNEDVKILAVAMV